MISKKKGLGGTMRIPKIRIHIVVIKRVLNQGVYLTIQKVDAIGGESNRHGTRVEHNCDDRELARHPEWLMEHYIEHGGAKWAAEQFRDKLWVDVEIPLHIYLFEQIRLFLKFSLAKRFRGEIYWVQDLTETTVLRVIYHKHTYKIADFVRCIFS